VLGLLSNHHAQLCRDNSAKAWTQSFVNSPNLDPHTLRRSRVLAEVCGSERGGPRYDHGEVPPSSFQSHFVQLGTVRNGKNNISSELLVAMVGLRDSGSGKVD